MNQQESVKIGTGAYQKLSRFAELYGMSCAEITRRALDMYLEIRKAPEFWRVVEKLNGRKLSTVIIELLVLWVEGDVKLNGD